MQGYKMHG
jgi:hypothetical protein